MALHRRFRPVFKKYAPRGTARFAKPLQGPFSLVAKHPQKHKNRPEIGRFSHFNPGAEMHLFSLFSASKSPEKWLYDAICRKKQLFAGSFGSRSHSSCSFTVADTLRYFVMDKPDALIIDFFAGSGTTLHAVNLLNAEDGGHRRCVIVTNNEVSDTEAKEMTKRGLKPGDEEWEALGIARYVTWPRTVCAIEGHDVNGNPLKGNYLGSDIPMSDGFNSNAIYFKLGFLDKTAVALGMQFKEMLPVLWMTVPGSSLKSLPDPG